MSYIDINMLRMLETEHIQPMTIDVDLYYEQNEYDWIPQAGDYVTFNDLTGGYSELLVDYNRARYRNVPNSQIIVTKCYYDNLGSMLSAKKLFDDYDLDYSDTQFILLTDDTGKGI